MHAEHEQHDVPAEPDGNREAMDRLNEQHRVLLESRMIAPHVPLSEEHHTQIREAFKAYIEEHGIRPAQVAREVDYVPAVLSDWAKGKYKGDNDKVSRAVNAWMERDARRRQAKRPSDYVNTRIAEDIRSYIYLADKHRNMAVIVAPAGTGKTKVLKAVLEDMPAAVYVCCTERMRLRGLYQEIARTLGWNVQQASTHVLERYIIERLTATRGMLMIDEAHLMGRDIQALRSIHDAAEVPIVMVGTDAIEAAADDSAHGRGQFSSRTFFYNALDHVKNAERPGGSAGQRDLFSMEEIRAYFAKRRIRLDNDAFRMMWALACLPGHGCLRLVERVSDAALAFTSDAERLSLDHVMAALRMVASRNFDVLNRLANRQAEAVPATAVAAAG